MSPSDLVGTAAWCEGVHRIYRTVSGEVHALRGVDVTIPKGRLTAVAGPSGSGKSSLLRILAGLDAPTAGTVLIGGIATAGLRGRDLRRLRRRHLGYVFQRPSHNLVAQLTARQHLEHAWHVRAAATDDPPAAPGVDDLLDLLGLADRASHRPSELSGGEQQRLAFAQAVVGRPTLVVADEPTGELDSRSAEELLDLTARLARLGSAILVSSHDAQVTAAADVIIELRNGALQGERVRDDDGRPGETLAVIDAAGRVQLPEHLLTMFPGRRARLRAGDDGVWLGRP